MSPIGRIFIVLNLILSAAFLGWASNALATVEDYKGQLEQASTDHAAALKEKDDEISALNVANNDLSEAQRRFRTERDSAQGNADSLQTQLDEEKRRNDKLEANLAEIQATLGDYNATITQLSGEKDRAIERAHEAENERDDAVTSSQAAEMAKRDAEEAAQQAQTRIADLEVERTRLTDDVASLNTRLQVLVDQTGVDVSEIMVQPQIEGAVLDVRMDLAPGLVMLNVGASHDVKRGYTFEIYRGGQYKGQVRVENVQDNISSAIITRSVPGTSIAQGDRAATQL